MKSVTTTASFQRLYWIATMLFLLIFVGSVVLNLATPTESAQEYVRLHFPAWLVYPTSLAKTLGIVAIITNRSQTLKDFAFAGFLYDLLLALGGSAALGRLDVLALVTLALWGFAFTMDRRMYPAAAGRRLKGPHPNDPVPT